MMVSELILFLIRIKRPREPGRLNFSAMIFPFMRRIILIIIFLNNKIQMNIAIRTCLAYYCLLCLILTFMRALIYHGKVCQMQYNVIASLQIVLVCHEDMPFIYANKSKVAKHMMN